MDPRIKSAGDGGRWRGADSNRSEHAVAFLFASFHLSTASEITKLIRENVGVLGGFIALLSAATFAFNNASVRRGVLTGSVLQAMAITVPIGLPISFLAAVATGSLAAVAGFSTRALLALSLSGIMHFVWGRYCNYRATRAIGTNLVAPIQQINLIVTLLLAIWILGETLTPLRMLGIVLVLLGPSLTLRERDTKSVPALCAPAALGADVTVEDVADIPADELVMAGAPVFRPSYAEGYFWALLSATGYGLSPILVRIGLEGKGLAVSVAGNLVASLAATGMMGLFLLPPRQLRRALAVEREPAKWFTLSGILVAISQLFLYMAMSIAPVTVVSPINRLSILFRLYFSRLLNPQHEVFGGKVVLGTVVSLTGAVVLSLSVDAVQSWLPLPEPVLAALRWHWP
jgi:uncharacterized membrane protein